MKQRWLIVVLVLFIAVVAVVSYFGFERVDYVESEFETMIEEHRNDPLYIGNDGSMHRGVREASQGPLPCLVLLTDLYKSGPDSCTPPEVVYYLESNASREDAPGGFRLLSLKNRTVVDAVIGYRSVSDAERAMEEFRTTLSADVLYDGVITDDVGMTPASSDTYVFEITGGFPGDLVVPVEDPPYPSMHVLRRRGNAIIYAAASTSPPGNPGILGYERILPDHEPIDVFAIFTYEYAGERPQMLTRNDSIAKYACGPYSYVPELGSEQGSRCNGVVSYRSHAFEANGSRMRAGYVQFEDADIAADVASTIPGETFSVLDSNSVNYGVIENVREIAPGALGEDIDSLTIYRVELPTENNETTYRLISLVRVDDTMYFMIEDAPVRDVSRRYKLAFTEGLRDAARRTLMFNERES